MTGHAFQELVQDDEIRVALGAIRRALVAGGRFVFETRNPLLRSWEQWDTEYTAEILDGNGSVVRRTSHPATPDEDGVMRGGSTFTCPKWDHPEVSEGALRFLNVDALASFLTAAGLEIEAQFGDWDRRAWTDTSPETITIAGKG